MHVEDVFHPNDLALPCVFDLVDESYVVRL